MRTLLKRNTGDAGSLDGLYGGLSAPRAPASVRKLSIAGQS